MLRFTGEKMSKSEGNVVTIRDAVDRWGRETVLLFFMTGHWSKPIDFSEETMLQARAQLDTFQNAVLLEQSGEADWGELERALENDFNTPDALAVLHSWRAQGATEHLRRGLGLFGIEPQRFDAPNLVRSLAEDRQSARAAGNFEEADRLREEIAAAGWNVRDVADGFQLVPK
jgi:cysteinyl-tRNA synthetase